MKGSKTRSKMEFSSSSLFFMKITTKFKDLRRMGRKEKRHLDQILSTHHAQLSYSNNDGYKGKRGAVLNCNFNASKRNKQNETKKRESQKKKTPRRAQLVARSMRSTGSSTEHCLFNDCLKVEDVKNRIERKKKKREQKKRKSPRDKSVLSLLRKNLKQSKKEQKCTLNESLKDTRKVSPKTTVTYRDHSSNLSSLSNAGRTTTTPTYGHKVCKRNPVRQQHKSATTLATKAQMSEKNSPCLNEHLAASHHSGSQIQTAQVSSELKSKRQAVKLFEKEGKKSSLNPFDFSM